MRAAALLLLLALSACPGWLKVVRDVAVLTADVCDTLDGGKAVLTLGPPPLACLHGRPIQ